MSETEGAVRIDAPADSRDTVILDGSTDPARNGQRISVLTAALNMSEAKVNHFDSLRQNQMAIALVIFAGLFGFGVKGSNPRNEMRGLATSLALVVLMAVVCALDRRFHRLGHGWRGTKKYVLLALAQATNEPESRISFQLYRASSQRHAKWFSLQPLLYYLLTLGGGLSYFAFK